MEAQAWTAIGLLAATLVGTLFYVGNKIDALGARLDGRIDALAARIDALSDRVDRLTDRLHDHLRGHAG